MPLIIFGIGSNLGNKLNNIKLAVDSLIFAFGNPIACASVYESVALKPLQSLSIPDYLNTAIAFDINKPPLEVFHSIKIIEKKIGRKLRTKWHSREIDIDILIYHNNEINSDLLKIPHAELHNRDFVLIPLIEILTKLKLDISIYERSLLQIKDIFIKKILLDNVLY